VEFKSSFGGRKIAEDSPPQYKIDFSALYRLKPSFGNANVRDFPIQKQKLKILRIFNKK